MKSAVHRLLVGSILVAHVVGCGEVPQPAASNSKSTPKTKAKAAPVPAEPPVDPNAFSSYEEAMTTIARATAEQKSAEINKAERWLGLQGEAISSKLMATVKDSSAPLASRIAGCRILSRLGTVATPTLMEVSQKDYKPDQLRQNGVQWLGMIKPTTKEIVDRLIVLSDEKGGDKATTAKIRTAALQAMLKIGPEVKKLRPDSVEKLQTMMNSTTEDDSIRGQAKAALKAIEPRRGFSGMGSIDKK